MARTMVSHLASCILWRTKWAEANPAAAKLFSIMKLSINDVNAQNMRMHSGESSDADIERHVNGWINAHQATFDGWVKTAAEAANSQTAQ